MFQPIGNAISDIRESIGFRRLWIALAQENIGDQHRRTALGPLWLLVNYLIFIATFVFLFNGGSEPMYVAYVAIGLLIWFYLMEVISEGVTLFMLEESFIKGTRLPLPVYVMRLMMQSLIRNGYAMIGCLIILLVSGVPLTLTWIWSGIGLFLILAITPAAILVFAFLGAYAPDSQYIVSNLMRVGMFITPVFWIYSGGGGGARDIFYRWNPFTYFLEIVRVPIISGEVPLFAFAVSLVTGLCLWIVALFLLGWLRKRVVFIL